MKTRCGWLALVLTLAACGGGGDDDGGPGFAPAGGCFPFGGGASQLDTAPAPTASFENAPAMFDGNTESLGTLETLAGTGISSLTGTAQPGVVVPGGMVAGVLLGGPLNNNLVLTITTYLAGVVQDSGPALTNTTSDDHAFYGIQTSSPFDAIEAAFTLVADDASIPIRELCFIEPFSF